MKKKHHDMQKRSSKQPHLRTGVKAGQYEGTGSYIPGGGQGQLLFLL